MTNASIVLDKYAAIAGLLTVIAVLLSMIYLHLQNMKLKSQLDASQFQNTKDQNNEAVHAESDDALKSELDNDVGH